MKNRKSESAKAGADLRARRKNSRRAQAGYNRKERGKKKPLRGKISPTVPKKKVKESSGWEIHHLNLVKMEGKSSEPQRGMVGSLDERNQREIAQKRSVSLYPTIGRVLLMEKEVCSMVRNTEDDSVVECEVKSFKRSGGITDGQGERAGRKPY